MSATKWIVAVVAIVVVAGLAFVVLTNLDDNKEKNKDDTPGLGTDDEILTITFNTMNGSSIAPISIVKNGYFSMTEEPTRKGYEFYGWYKDKSCTDSQVFTLGTKVESSMTLYAKWVLDESSDSWCTISFETNGGSEVSAIYALKGDTISPSSPTKSDFEFGGWYTDSTLKNQWDPQSKITASMTLYAMWNNLKDVNYSPTASPDHKWVTTYTSKDPLANESAGDIYMVVSIGTVEDVILAKHSDVERVNSSSQTLSIAYTQHTEETITKSITQTIGTSTSHSMGANLGFSKILSVGLSYSYGITHHQETSTTESHALTTAKSIQNTSVYTIDFVTPGKYVIACTIGNVEAYQIFILNPVTGEQSVALAYRTWGCYNTVVSATTPDDFVTVSDLLNAVDPDLSKVFKNKGKGINGDAYQITDAEMLLSCAFGATAHYKLMNDLNLSGIEWVPLGTFKGDFDGNSKTINNMAIDFNIKGGVKSNNRYIGFFSFIGVNGNVHNLKMSNASIVCSEDPGGTNTLNAGIIAGGSEGYVKWCTVVHSQINVHRSVSSIGGIIGRNIEDIDNCTVSNSEFTGRGNMGGLVGRLDSLGSVTNCAVNNCEVNFSTKDSRGVGGLVGYSVQSKIENCTTTKNKFMMTSSIIGHSNGAQLGYLVGHVEKSTINNIKDDGSSNNIPSGAPGGLFSFRHPENCTCFPTLLDSAWAPMKITLHNGTYGSIDENSTIDGKKDNIYYPTI